MSRSIGMTIFGVSKTGMIKYLRLNNLFDVEKMQREMALLEESAWLQHYNKSHYDGSWSILPLRSIGGNAGNIVSVHVSSAGQMHRFQNTKLLDICPYFQSILEFFECEKGAVRLMKLHSGSVIKEHRDHEMSFEEGEARFHIPVVTNPGVGFYLDDEQVIMQAGECWYLNLSLKHQVKNEGATDRVHLVVDCIVNEWVKKLFKFGAGLQKHIEPEIKKEPPKEDKLKIIDQLKALNTPTALELAKQMEKDLQ